MIDLSAGGGERGGTQLGNLQFVESSSRFAQPSGPPPAYDAGEQPATAVDSFAPGFLKTARHPFVCIFHLFFKALALTTFLFGSFLFGGWTGDYVFSFVTTTIFLSMDFWTVKNITGRLLVGMRWWNHIKDDGSNEWLYEAHTDERVINLTDKTVFWAGLYIWPLCWIVFFIVYLLRLEIEWVLLVVVGIVLSTANLVGYWRCSKEAKRRVEQWATTKAIRAVLGRFF